MTELKIYLNGFDFQTCLIRAEKPYHEKYLRVLRIVIDDYIFMFPIQFIFGNMMKI